MTKVNACEKWLKKNRLRLLLKMSPLGTALNENI